MKLSTFFIVAGTLAGNAWAADSKVKMQDLPPAVQATVKAETQNATLVGISKEVEKGKTMYEVESKIGDKTRDLMIDAAGKVVSVEEEVDLSSIPAAARSAIEKKAAGAKITKVEKLTQGGTVSYEAVIQKGSKKSEFTVNADGSVHK